MNWIERREGVFLTSPQGKVLGKVWQTLGSSLHSAEAIYAAGGNHKNPLGDYISEPSARKAVEEHVKALNLPGTEE